MIFKRLIGAIIRDKEIIIHKIKELNKKNESI